MRTLIIGGGGYIGQVLSRCLSETGPVTVVDTFIYGKRDDLESSGGSGVSIVERDMRDPETLDELISQHEAVVHLGGFVGEPASDLDQVLTVQTNYAAPVLAAEIASRRQHVRKFIFASTCSVYGVQEGVADEDATPRPVSLYAATKLAAERRVLSAFSDGREAYALRLSTVFGPSPRPRLDSVVNRMSAMAAIGHNLRVDSGAAWRPFVHVADVADVISALLAAPAGEVTPGSYNVGSLEETMTIPQLARVISEHCDVEALPSGQSGDGRSYRVSFDKLESALGRVCKRNITDGVDEVIQMVRRHKLDYRQAPYDNFKGLSEALRRGTIRPIDGQAMVRLVTEYAEIRGEG